MTPDGCRGDEGECLKAHSSARASVVTLFIQPMEFWDRCGIMWTHGSLEQRVSQLWMHNNSKGKELLWFVYTRVLETRGMRGACRASVSIKNEGQSLSVLF